ncbi:hypothetical protein [Thioclava atlantica]|uniref:NADH dehydrogenase subunit E n=1 Tax=Thioclava atlantica TaxID=1317124 RepID=A0A085TUQ2_9RHOB|nr:hypothetical protein [Thioclava atlantica]KFE34449.1 hypothetical protein DW2_12890 [Thioclava atlantica]
MGDQMQGCRGKAGIWAGITGLIVAVFLMVVAHEPFYVAVFMGLLTVLLFGGFLIWAFCTGRDVPEAARPSSAPAKEPAIPESPVETFNAQSPEGAAAHAQAAAAVPASEPAAAAQPAPEPKPAPAPAPAAAEAPQVEVKAEAAKPAPVEETAPKAAAPAVGQPAAAEGPGKKPRGLKAPRKAGADDLKKIEGIGPKLEETLNGWGIYHFDQIAKWGPEEVAYADQNVPRFKGRCTRDKWVSQARIIVEDGMDAFLERAKTNDY